MNKIMFIIILTSVIFTLSTCDKDCKSGYICADTLAYYKTIIEAQGEYIAGLEEFCLQTELRCEQFELHNRKLDSAFQIMIYRYDTLYRSKYCTKELVNSPNYVIKKGDCEKIDSLLTELICTKPE